LSMRSFTAQDISQPCLLKENLCFFFKRSLF